MQNHDLNTPSLWCDVFNFWIKCCVFSHLNAEMFEKEIYINYETLVMLYVKVSLLQCNYTLKYWVIIINHMYLL